MSVSSRPLSHWVLLFALVAMWGSSFLFTRVAVADLSPTLVVAARLAIAATVLGCALAVIRPPVRMSFRLVGFFGVMAIVGNALPFWLISWGQQHITSALAGILMAVMPLATVGLAHLFVPGERLTGPRLAGFLLGFCGIVVLEGPGALDAVRGVGGTLLAELAVLGGALCYAVGAIVARRRPSSDPLVAASGVALAASVLMVPISVWTAPRPDQVTTSAAIAVAFLGLVSTAIATIVYFKLVTLAGPSFLSLINYFIPLWAVALGFWALGEVPHWSAFAALAIVLAGVALSEIPTRRRETGPRDSGPTSGNQTGEELRIPPS